MTWGAPEAAALFAAMESKALTLGVFDRVNTHEPENTPGNGTSCSLTFAGVVPDAQASGLSEVSGKVTFAAKIWNPMNTRPQDAIDPHVLAAVVTLMSSFANGFTLGGTVRNVHLFGMRADPAYVLMEGREFRVVTVTVPVIINDLYPEVA